MRRPVPFVRPALAHHLNFAFFVPLQTCRYILGMSPPDWQPYTPTQPPGWPPACAFFNEGKALRRTTLWCCMALHGSKLVAHHDSSLETRIHIRLFMTSVTCAGAVRSCIRAGQGTASLDTCPRSTCTWCCGYQARFISVRTATYGLCGLLGDCRHGCLEAELPAMVL
jgi:hypothetical protein